MATKMILAGGVAMESGSGVGSRGLFLKLSVVIVVAVVISAVLLVYYSPKYSWDASIRDHDGDGYVDNEDAFPDDPTEWSDSDEDGYGDNCDHFPEDGDEWDDSDADGVGDNSDEFPAEPTQWEDSDGDGYGDNSSGVAPDAFPDDPTEWNDTDGDGVGDNADEFPDDPDEWEDTDGDGYGDNSDAFPQDESRSTPVASFDCVETEDGFNFECTYMETELAVAWDDVTFSLGDSTDTVFWTAADSTALSEHTFAVQFLDEADIAGMVLSLSVTDLAGNGVLDVEDRFAVFTEEVFTAGVEFLLEVVYEPTECAMDSLTFMKDLIETPTSTLTRTTVTAGFKFTFLPVTVDTQWDDITVLLSDGTNTVEWSPATASLDNGTASKQVLGERTLTSLSVYCNVTDLAGNGYVNQGDYFVLTAGGGSFSAATTYTVTIKYDPTAGTICSMVFRG